MRNLIRNAIFSFSSVAIIVGVAGFVSSIVTLFIDIETQISVKWLLGVIVICVSVFFILIKLIYDVSQKTVPPPAEIPIRYLPDEKIFIIRKNENFVNHIVVGCYEKKDGIDRLAYLGIVHLVQEKIIQVQIRKDFGIIDIHSISRNLDNIEIKPVVPTIALEHYNDQEGD